MCSLKTIKGNAHPFGCFFAIRPRQNEENDVHDDGWIFHEAHVDGPCCHGRTLHFGRFVEVLHLKRWEKFKQSEIILLAPQEKPS